MTRGLDFRRNTKEQISRYPVLLKSCHESALAYATCVLKKVNLDRNNCQLEFSNFKACLIKNAMKRSKKI